MPEFVRFRRPYVIFLSLTLLLFLNACTTSEAPAIPQEEQIEVSSVQGLTGAYFDNETFEGNPVTRVDSEVDFDWGDQEPVSGVNATGYSVRWIGQVQPDTTGSYTFSLNTTGRARLWVNGVLAAQVGWSDPGEQFSQSVDLQAGTKVDLTLEYKQGGASGSVIRLEWQQGGAASVVPSSRLSSIGSNLQTAINTLEANPYFTAFGSQLDEEYALGSLTPSGYGLIAQQPEQTTFYVATFEGNMSGKVQTLYEMAIDEQGSVVFSDLLSSRSIALGNVEDYVDGNGDPLAGQQAALEALLYDFFSSTGASGELSGQSLGTQQVTSAYDIPHCGVCTQAANGLEGAYIGQATSSGVFLVGLITKGVGKLGGRIANLVRGTDKYVGNNFNLLGVGGMIASSEAARRAEQNYLDCIAGKIPESASTGGCPPEIRVTPRSISKELAVGEEAIVNTEIMNTSASEARLFYWVQQVGDVFADRLGEVDLRGTLDPGQTTQFGHRLYCQKVGTFTGTITITHNANNEASPITIPVTLECYEPEPDISEPTPETLRLSAEPDDFDTGSFEFSNDGTAELTYSLSHGYALLDIVSPKSGVLAPGDTATIAVDAHCNGKAETLKFTISITSNDPDERRKFADVELACVGVVASDLMFARHRISTFGTTYKRGKVYGQGTNGWQVVTGYYWYSEGDFIVNGTGGTAYFAGFRGSRWTGQEFARQSYRCQTGTSMDYVFRTEEAMQQLQACMTSYRDDTFQQAIPAIQAYAEANPEKVPFYTGESLVNLQVGEHPVFKAPGVLGDILLSE